jgi:hypothetical protein
MREQVSHLYKATFKFIIMYKLRILMSRIFNSIFMNRNIMCWQYSFCINNFVVTCRYHSDIQLCLSMWQNHFLMLVLILSASPIISHHLCDQKLRHSAHKSAPPVPPWAMRNQSNIFLLDDHIYTILPVAFGPFLSVSYAINVCIPHASYMLCGHK